jgi:hypothetical protein
MTMKTAVMCTVSTVKSAAVTSFRHDLEEG